MTWTIIGTALWFAYVTCRALGEYCWHLIDFMRTHSAAPSWESSFPIPAGFLGDLEALLPILKANEWLSSPEDPCPLDDFASWLATDSSSHAGAAMTWNCQSMKLLATWWQFQPSTRTSNNMPMKEGLALLHAVQQPVCLPSPMLWLTDCLPFLQAYRRKYSPSPEVNAVILAVERSCKHRGYRLHPMWITTLMMQLACDPMSRRWDECSSFQPYFPPIPFPAPALLSVVLNHFSSGHSLR